MEVDDTTSDSSLLFIGNGQYQPRGFAPTVRETLDDGLLDLRILNASNRRRRFRVLTGILTGQLARVREYHELSSPELYIRLPDGPERIARDGEVGEAADELRVRVRRRALRIYQPW